MAKDDFQKDALDRIADAAGRVSTVKNWFDDAKKTRQAKSDRWRKNERLYYGNHWYGTKLPKGRSKLVFNIPLSSVETQLPIISDFLPAIDVLPDKQNDMIFADMMQKRVKQVVGKEQLYEKAIASIKDSLIYSDGLLGIMPILGDDGSLVGVEVTVPDIYTCFPESWATGLELGENCKYIIFATPMYVKDIEEGFGVSGVSGEANLDDYRAFQVSTDQEQVTSQPDSENDMALLLECFSDDPDKDNYPNGRISVQAGEVLISDEPLELPRIPYFKISNYGSPHSFWGIGEPELTKTQVKALNETMSAINDNIKKTGNPIMKIVRSAASKLEKPITGEPGEKVLVDRGDDFGYENPPSIPAYTQNWIEQVRTMTDQITGVTDVTQGRKPTGVTAASAITALQEAAQTRIRFKIEREISGFMKEVGEFLVWILQTYDSEVVSIRERDADGNSQFVTYDPVGVYDSEGRQAGEEGFNLGAAQSLADSTFDIEVVPGRRTPAGRVWMEERALNLWDRGVYGIEQLVNALDEPNKQEVIEGWYERNMGGGGDIPPEAAQMFEQLSQTATPGSPEEDQLAQLLAEYPQLGQISQEQANGVPS